MKWTEGHFAIAGLVVGAVFAIGLIIGMNYGWEQRIHYEVIQCADFGRCFH